MTLGNSMPDESSCVDELRRRMKNSMPDDMYEDDNLFKRFLRARNHNIDAAELMLRNNVSWREVFKMDDVANWRHPNQEILDKYVTWSKLGYNVEGSPVIYYHFGGLDARNLCNRLTTKPDAVKYIAKRLEEELAMLRKENEKSGKSADQWTFIFNFDNLKLSNATNRLTVETLIALAQMYDANYPERLYKCYFINASVIFTLLWGLVKPFLAFNTVQKIKIFGKEGWEEQLKKDVNPDILPAFLGGNLTDPDGDPKCKTMINYGGPIAEHYFVHLENARNIPGAKKLIVNRMSKVEVKVDVLYPESTLEWEFIVKNKDIDFSVSYCSNRNSTPDSKDLVPKQRIETSISSESGLLKCGKIGVYVLEFDNTYSWVHSKEIYYTTSVTHEKHC